MEIADYMLLIAVISQGICQQKHCLVVDAVIISSTFFRVLTVFIAINSLDQIGVCALCQIRLVKQLAALRQQAGNGPAMVWGMEI